MIVSKIEIFFIFLLELFQNKSMVRKERPARCKMREKMRSSCKKYVWADFCYAGSILISWCRAKQREKESNGGGRNGV